MARWQRERRQMAIVVTVFTAILVFVLGIAAWAASDRYYQANLTAAATIGGVSIPKRDYQAQLRYELVRLYQDYGVPAGFENDPKLASAKAQYQDLALERVVEHRVLDRAAREVGIALTPEQADEQYQVALGEFRVRHILISVDKAATDQTAADATAKAKARAIADQLKQAPLDQDLWNRLAKDKSEDPGTKDSGGELGWAGHGQYVPEFDDAIRALRVGEVSDPIHTSFGYHVIQLEEKRPPEQTDIVKRYLAYGFKKDDLKAQSRYEALRKEFGRRAEAAATVSPTEQVHLAKIVIRLPAPTSGDYQSFLDALKKQTDTRQKLEAGTDFAQLAKDASDDSETKDKGGDMGWVARGMLADPRAEELGFATEVGKTTEPTSTSRDWTIYKVLEKQPSRELTEDQRSTLKQTSYQYWLARQKKAYNVQKLIPGLSFD